MTVVKQKKCKCCKALFTPSSTTQTICSMACAINTAKDNFKSRHNKEENEKIKRMRESLKTHADHIKELQVIFNSYIRARDKGLPCVSCGTPMTGRKGDASHFYSAGGNPSVRFNEDNVHLACVPCNQYRHGNLHEYAERLPDRIGQDRVNELRNAKNAVLKLSIPEIKELKIKYTTLTKELNKKP